MDRVELITQCRLCNSADLSKIISLEKNPVGDRFFSDLNLAKSMELHNVELMLCRSCGQIQLSEVVEPNDIYTEEYLYTSSTSVGLIEHFRNSAMDIIGRFNIPKDSLIIEIGSNEGAMLGAFKELGMKVLGIDPAQRAVDIANKNGVETIYGFFSKEMAEYISSFRGKAKVVIANNVIANIPLLKNVIDGISILLDDNGIFVFETSYAQSVIKKHLIDTIYHEHISYLSVKPLNKFFNSCGLELFDAEEIWTKGGSLRGYVSKPSCFAKTQRLYAIIGREEKYLLLHDNVFSDFTNGLDRFRMEVRKLALDIKERQGSVGVYGASVGGVMMVYHLGLSDVIDYFLDDNIAKIGKYAPNLGLPVKDSRVLEGEGIKECISVAWRFMKTITSKHIDFLNNGGIFHSLELPSLSIRQYTMNDISDAWGGGRIISIS